MQVATHFSVVRLRKLGRLPSASVIELADQSSAAVEDIGRNRGAVVDYVLARIEGLIEDAEERAAAIEWVHANAQLTIATTKHLPVHPRQL